MPIFPFQRMTHSYNEVKRSELLAQVGLNLKEDDVASAASC